MTMYTAKYNDIHAIVNISGRFNLQQGIEGRLGKDFLQRIKQDGFIDVKNKRGGLSDITVLFFDLTVACFDSQLNIWYLFCCDLDYIFNLKRGYHF